MYIVKADYKTRINIDLLNRIIQEGESNGEDILATVSKIAEDTIGTLAGVLYNTSEEFTKIGSNRNHLIVKWALNLATYEVYQRIDDEEVPEKVIKNYDDTIDDLIDVSKGKYPLNLPSKESGTDGSSGGSGSGGESVQTDGGGLRRLGSQAKRSHQV